MVVMASGIGCGRIRTTAATESRNMVAIMGCQRHAAFVYYVLLWYWTSMLWQGICWPISHDHIVGSSLQLVEVKNFFEVERWPGVGFSIGSLAHVWLTCWKQGRVVRKPVNANPGLKVNRIIPFSSIQMFLLLCFVYIYVIGQLRGPYREKLWPRSWKGCKPRAAFSSTFSWVSLIGLWTTRPRSYAFRLA